MNIQQEEICGYFTVEDENHELRQIIVTQDVLFHYSKEKRYTKTFRLESLDGAVAFQTKDPDVLQLSDGTLLKRKKR